MTTLFASADRNAVAQLYQAKHAAIPRTASSDRLCDPPLQLIIKIYLRTHHTTRRVIYRAIDSQVISEITKRPMLNCGINIVDISWSDLLDVCTLLVLFLSGE